MITLVLHRGDGSSIDITLLRGPEWIADYGAHVGGTVLLGLTEMAAVGPAEVLDIDESPRIDPGHGRLITGTFHHTAAVVYNLKVESEREALGVTGTHPFWSVDRQAWVAAADLNVGETLKTLEGTTVVESIGRRPEPERVCNIEVEGDHVYRVGESGVLVHNVSQKVRIFSEKYFGGDFTTSGPNSPKYNTGANRRAEKTEARVCEVGGNTTKPQKPVGWNVTWNQGLGLGEAKVARCHLLARELGGTHERKNIVPCCQTDNRKMADVEKAITDFIKENGCVDVQVVATYSGPRSKIPTTVTLTAVGQECSTGKRKDFSFTVTNPPRGMPSCPVAGS